MPSSSRESLEARASGQSVIMYVVFDLVAQTFAFGVYTLLLCLSTRMLLKRGLKTQANRIMLFITLFMYLLSAAYWGYTIVYVANLLRSHIDVPLKSLPNHDKISKWIPLLNAIVMINFVLSDGVVLWRAWVITPPTRKMRKYLWVTMCFVALTAIAVALIIAFRIVAIVQAPIDDLAKDNFGYLESTINVLQVSAGMFSLTSNLTATAVVGVTAWRYRQALRNAFKDDETNTQSDKILALVVEVGSFYCLSTLIVLVASLIRLPLGTIGDLYGPINIHITGAYPPVVILLVSMKRSLSDTAFSDTGKDGRSTALPSLQFASANVSPTTTIGGDPDAIHHQVEKTKPKPNQMSRFSDSSFDRV
ncbi:hypothetical protein MVEN_00345600 [Mycena venus]|uniref:Uncharacterized protein n=1 Tax=Mycena venus TaxID=2733690 RepID=A0A8H6YT82_9AGAR|nr:hypothetical protein MVEN_00345600 [Mycena venus]